MKKLKKVLCYFGFHYGKPYIIDDVEYRTCKWCGKSQVYIYEGEVSGMADISYWEDIKLKPTN